MSRTATTTTTTAMTSIRSTRPRSDLFPYQREKMIPKFVETKQVGGFVQMGLGKTICALTALVDLGMPRTLVVAPARVVETRVWKKEAVAWEHTAGISVVSLDGGPKRRVESLGINADVNVVSYELFPWLTETLDVEELYGAIVFDELSKMKTPGSTRFKRMRTRSMEIPIRFGLTGSPVGNHYVDLWGEMFAVAGEKPLGPSKALYCAQYFTAIPINEFGAKIWSINYGCMELINERVKPWAFSLDPREAPQFELRENPIHVELPKSVRELSDELARELRVKLASGAELLALSSGTRAAKVRQLAGGAVYVDGESWEHVHDAKLEALDDVIDELQGEPTLVFYWYRHEKERLLKRFPQARAYSPENVDLWNAGKIEMLVVHPASVGYGINLQHGGHNIVWYTLPWSWELYSQANARLARTGQKSPFTLAHILLAGEADLAVLGALREKEKAERLLTEAVRLQ